MEKWDRFQKVNSKVSKEDSLRWETFADASYRSFLFNIPVIRAMFIPHISRGDYIKLSEKIKKENEFVAYVNKLVAEFFDESKHTFNSKYDSNMTKILMAMTLLNTNNYIQNYDLRQLKFQNKLSAIFKMPVGGDLDVPAKIRLKIFDLSLHFRFL